MTGFVVNTDAGLPVLPSPVPDVESVIPNGWFPDLDPTAIRAAYRVVDKVTAPRLREALIAGIITVGNDLTAWSAGKRLAGYASLGDVPADQIDGKSKLVVLYVRAVALNAKAELVERFRDLDITGAGERKVDDLDASVGELRRDAIHAVRDMLGVTRTTVELI